MNLRALVQLAPWCLWASVCMAQVGLDEFRAQLAVEMGEDFDALEFVEFSITQNGEVVFEAFNLVENASGLFRYRAGMMGAYEPVFLTGEQTPGLPGRFFLTGPTGSWVARNSGVVFNAFTTDGQGDEKVAVFICRPECTSVFLVGDTLPNQPDLTLAFGALNTRLNARGEIAFYATLAGPAAPPGTRRAFVAGLPENLEIVAREGGLAPDGMAWTGAMFDDTTLVLNDDGVFSFIGTRAQDDSQTGVWSQTAAGLVRQALVGEEISTAGAVWSRIGAVAAMSLNQLMIVDEFSGRVFVGDGAQPALFRLAASAGQTLAIAPDATLGSISPPTVNSNGRIAFVSAGGTVGSTTVQRMLVADQPLGLTLIAYSGMQAPGMPQGVSFQDFSNQRPVINNLDQVAFRATLQGDGVTTDNQDSLWLYRPGLGLAPIARQGAPLRVQLADVRTVATLYSAFPSGSTLSPTQGSNEDGGPLVFNDRGELIFGADFVDGSSALIIGGVRTVVFRDGFETSDVSP